MLTHVIFRDGSKVDVKEAARIIGMQEKPSDNLKGIYDGFETFVFWRRSGDRLHFTSTSGGSLCDSIEIESTDEYGMGFKLVN